MESPNRVWEFSGGLEVEIVSKSLFMGKCNFHELPCTAHGYDRERFEQLQDRIHSIFRDNNLIFFDRTSDELRPVTVAGNTNTSIVFDCLNLYTRLGPDKIERMFAQTMVKELGQSATQPNY